MNRRDFIGLTAAGTAMMTVQPSQAAARSLTVASGDILISRPRTGNLLKARPGVSRIFKGDILLFRSAGSITLDWNQGYFICEPGTRLNVDRLGVRGGGAISHLTLFVGAIYPGVRKFNNPNSAFKIFDYTQSRIISVTGTTFGVSISGDRMIAAVDEGETSYLSAGSPVIIPARKVSAATLNKPPSQPVDIDTVMAAAIDFQEQIGRVEIRGRTDPFNRVRFNGQYGSVNESGELTLSYQGPIALGNDRVVTIVNPLGAERNYHFSRPSHPW